jgi:hypothetical protein
VEGALQLAQPAGQQTQRRQLFGVDQMMRGENAADVHQLDRDLAAIGDAMLANPQFGRSEVVGRLPRGERGCCSAFGGRLPRAAAAIATAPQRPTPPGAAEGRTGCDMPRRPI